MKSCGNYLVATLLKDVNTCVYKQLKPDGTKPQLLVELLSYHHSIQQRTISQEVHQILSLRLSLKVTHLRIKPHPPGASKLIFLREIKIMCHIHHQRKNDMIWHESSLQASGFLGMEANGQGTILLAQINSLVPGRSGCDFKHAIFNLYREKEIGLLWNGNSWSHEQHIPKIFSLVLLFVLHV